LDVLEIRVYRRHIVDDIPERLQHGDAERVLEVEFTGLQGGSPRVHSWEESDLLLTKTFLTFG
jgi:hypothetical protein